MRRSIFARILLWLLLTAGATAAIVVVASQVNAQPTLVDVFVGGLLDAHLLEARHVYEREGRAGLAQFVDRVARGFPPGVRVSGPDGRDLLTGEDLRPSLRLARTGLTALAFAERQALLTRATADGHYRIFMPVAGGGLLRRSIRPGPLLVLCALVGLCWALAAHISRPIVRLQHAVDRFGHGETDVRVRSARSDEIGELARAFDAMADRTSELVHGQRRLLLDISHELRSPLARLTIATDLVRADPTDAESLDQIDRETGRLNQLIGEILQAARPDSPDTRRQFADVRLDELVHDVVDRCRIEAGDRVGLAVTAAPVTLAAHEELLCRAIENVLRNALRHAPDGSHVDVDLAPAGGEARLTIRDRGPGVPEAALPHLFTPFYRCEPDRDRGTGGVGLGLAIARRAIAAHGGRIAARNAQPGLEVVVTLPLTGQIDQIGSGGWASVGKENARNDLKRADQI